VTDPRYPIGRFDFASEVTPDVLASAIADLEGAPAALRQAVLGLSAEQLETPYRPGGWTLRQVAHHVPDSHLNGYARMKLALTEDTPVIKPYHEDRWAELADSQNVPITVSLALLESLHARWVALCRSLRASDLARTFRHPETGATVRLDTHVAHYAWHGRHHTAQITSLLERMGWR
jgi:uncharacterized damage-inducible protein DinB